MVTHGALQWTAGFLEGEGSFYNIGKGRVPIVTASQVQREPLERLERLFGGSMYFNKAKQPRASDYWRWQVAGQAAVGLMFTLYTWMSPKRKSQIGATISTWKQRHAPAHITNRCRRGHDLSIPENVYHYPDSARRHCMICYDNSPSQQAVQAAKKGRKLIGLFCPNGHAMTPDNTAIHANRIRCRTCARAAVKAHYDRKKSQGGIG